MEAEGRLENLEEFVGVTEEFDRMNPDGTLADFLQEISLYADIDSLEEDQPVVTLMTLHNAKGLEFPVVFITGMEEGLFPHSRSLDEQRLEEERRLCYVGMTRARDRLYLSHARTRTLHGGGGYKLPSRFLGEIPGRLLEHRETSVWSPGSSRGGLTREAREGRLPAGRGDSWSSPGAGRVARRGPVAVPRGAGRKSRGTAPGAAGGAAGGKAWDGQAAAGFAPGDKVVHAKFGEGVVLGVEPGGIVRVFFSDLGEQKRLLLEYAPLRRV
jgi:DNA helicase-2/ATP-dependent DNA helicase PcrA